METYPIFLEWKAENWKMTYSPEVIYRFNRFNSVPIIILISFFTYQKKILKFSWKHRRPIAKTTLSNKNNV